jgi:hypothetical protein
MASTSNGHQDGSASRRFRFDDLASTVVQLPTPASGSGDVMPHHSGRRLVLVAGAAILVLWGALYLVFLEWRARYRTRTSFGVTQVAPVIDALAEIIPPGVGAGAWKEAVRETHAMLVSVMSANLLDVQQMQLLRDELKQTVERARLHPETARDELASVWTAMADRAEFVLQEGTSGRHKGHPRPAILPPRQVKEKGAKPELFAPPQENRAEPSPGSETG